MGVPGLEPRSWWSRCPYGAAHLTASMEEHTSAPNPGFVLTMLRLRAPPVGEKEQWEGDPQEAPQLPQPSVRSGPAAGEEGPCRDWGCSEPPTPSFQRDLYDRVSPHGPQGLKICRWNQNRIQMIRLNREAVASPVL